MTQVENVRGSPDDQVINVHDCDELLHWSKVLNTTPEKLKEAVIKVGTFAARVREHLETTRTHD